MATVAPYDAEAGAPPGRSALSLIPADAEVVTITDFDEARTQLGVPELTSADPMTDRNAFWRRGPQRTVLLTEGMLLPHTSALMLDHGFTQDDVDWEAHFTTPAGPGWILGFRPDLDMALVETAVAAGVAGLDGAVVDAQRHLVAVGMASQGEDTWGQRPGIVDLANDVPAEATYYRAGCVGLTQALGPDAGLEDVEALVSAHDPGDLDPLEAFGVSFVDGIATARLGLGRADLFDRAALARASGNIVTGFSEGFGRAVVDPSTGRIGYPVLDPPAAAALTLTEVLPFAVCDQVPPLEVPTGL